ncbi:MAG: DUF5011 domain-containing protein [Ginsengibacter sp.]
MIRIKKILLPLLAFAVFISCNKTDYNYPEGTVAGSKITFFPDLTYNGDNYVVVRAGETYTEPGVTAKENGAEIPVTIDGTVDTNTPGIYTLVYSAVNKDGFPATASRTVIVYETADDAIVNDFSGNYARTTNGSVATWTKLAPGVYKVFNPGGAIGTNLTVIVFNPTALTIFIPEQIASDGSVTSSTNESYTNSVPPQFSWKIVNPGYGTGQRTFTKQ